MRYDEPTIVVVAEASQVILGDPFTPPEDSPTGNSSVPGQVLGIGLDD